MSYIHLYAGLLTALPFFVDDAFTCDSFGGNRSWSSCLLRHVCLWQTDPAETRSNLLRPVTLPRKKIIFPPQWAKPLCSGHAALFQDHGQRSRSEGRGGHKQRKEQFSTTSCGQHQWSGAGMSLGPWNKSAILLPGFFISKINGFSHVVSFLKTNKGLWYVTKAEEILMFCYISWNMSVNIRMKTFCECLKPQCGSGQLLTSGLIRHIIKYKSSSQSQGRYSTWRLIDPPLCVQIFIWRLDNIPRGFTFWLQKALLLIGAGKAVFEYVSVWIYLCLRTNTDCQSSLRATVFHQVARISKLTDRMCACLPQCMQFTGA